MNRSIVAIAALALGCAATSRPSPGSQTHFLQACEDECPSGLACLCGVCTLACDDDAMCAASAESATCTASNEDGDACADAARVCDVECTRDGDCSALGADFACARGRCRAPDGPRPDAGPNPGGAAGSVPDASTDAGPISDGATGDAGTICNLPPETGECDAAITRYFHDPATRTCRAFTYGGCGGNDNNFASIDECTAACAAIDTCSLPPESGPCEAAITRYYHDPGTDTCRTFTYGGCMGNDNNFANQEECEGTCGATLPSGTACEVGGTVYPSGSDGIADPQSCNTCLCDQGQLICTEIACPEPCPAGTEYAVSCSQCGPADGCEILRSDCLPTCQSNADCTGDAPPFCFDGICRILCG
jgi:hypothetical protein